MTTENNGFDAGKFFDEGVEEAGLQDEIASESETPDQDESGVFTQQTSEEQTTEQAETEQEQETEQNAADSSQEEIQTALEQVSEPEGELESVISSLLPTTEQVEQAESQQKPDRTGQYVPVEDHIKLRKRAQEAERQRDELQQRLQSTQTGGEKPGEIEKSPLEKFVDENPDEEFVPAKVQLEQKQWEEKIARANAEAIAQREEQQRLESEDKQRRINSINAFNTKALESEKNFRKEHSDYDQVTKPIVQAGLLNQSDKLTIFKAENPTQKLYEICKAKKDAMAVMLGVTAKETPTETKSKTKASTTTQKGAAEKSEEEMTDDEIFEAVYGKPEY